MRNKLHKDKMGLENYPDPEIPVDDAWAQMKSMLDNVPGKLTPKDPVASVVRKMVWYGGAVLITASAITYFFIHDKPRKHQAAIESPAVVGDTGQDVLYASSHIYASQQTPQKDSLPNGVVLFLDQNSYIRVQRDAEKNSVTVVNGGVYLEGVESDGKEARVNIEAGEMEVLPHHASVYVAFDSVAGISSVQVQSGRAELRAGKASTMLLAGESVQFDEKVKRFSTKQKADVNAVSYATHIFEFSNTPLKDAVACIEKAYGVKIRLVDGKLSNDRITTRFDNKTLKEVLDIMAFTINFEYSLHEAGKEVKIKAANGRK